MCCLWLLVGLWLLLASICLLFVFYFYCLSLSLLSQAANAGYKQILSLQEATTDEQCSSGMQLLNGLLQLYVSVVLEGVMVDDIVVGVQLQSLLQCILQHRTGRAHLSSEWGCISLNPTAS